MNLDKATTLTSSREQGWTLLQNNRSSNIPLQYKTFNGLCDYQTNNIGESDFSPTNIKPDWLPSSLAVIRAGIHHISDAVFLSAAEGLADLVGEEDIAVGRWQHFS